MFMQFFDAPALSLSELTFHPAAAPVLPPAVVRTLAAINYHTPVSITEVQDAEWFRLKSDDWKDPQLFQGLADDWALIIGHNSLSFALLHCYSGPDQGVWLYYRNPVGGKAQFGPGCHQVTSLS
jgi:hypothetical protein